MMVGAAALTVAMTPTALAKQSDSPIHVCNQATHNSLGGDFIAFDEPVDSPAARYDTGIHAKPGQGAGLVNAAAHSPALTVCGPLEPEPGGGPVAT
jgi:hypothetical protein